MRKILFFIIIFFWPVSTVSGTGELPLTSPSVILAEQENGRILYEKNAYQPMYPASMTKILTAIVVLDYLDPDDVLVVGNEIYTVPSGYKTLLHAEGESITVRNLLRALMIRSSNEGGNVLALNAVRVKENRRNIPFADAEKKFCELMNEKARALGAFDSNFTNAYGLHSENHYTTAYDMALIARAYMEAELLKEIAGTQHYAGDGLEGTGGAWSREYDLYNHNALLRYDAYYYPYATGIKTGFTDPAGHCLAASAEKGPVSLVAILFQYPEPEPERWEEAQLLLDYGFAHYQVHTFQLEGGILDTVITGSPRLGNAESMSVLADEAYQKFLSHEEFDRVKRIITYDEVYLAERDTFYSSAMNKDEPPRLRGPIAKDEIIGKIVYILDDGILYEGKLRAASGVQVRPPIDLLNFNGLMEWIQAAEAENETEGLFDRIFSDENRYYRLAGIGIFAFISAVLLIAGKKKTRRSGV